ncbi:MAG: DUF4012 domain-containing protein [Patescibacteria group bacterium]
MKKFIPKTSNLTPDGLGHVDRAGQLGVPKNNIIDLRALVPLAPEIKPVIKVEKKAVLNVQPIPEPAKLVTPPVVRQRHTTWHLSFAWKPALAFAVVAGLALLPAATIAMLRQANPTIDDIRLLSGAAVDDMQAGKFDKAEISFQEAQDKLHTLNATLSPVYGSTDNLLIAGEQIAGAGTDMVKAFNLIEQLSQTTSDSQPVDLFVAAHSLIRPIVPRLQRANLALSEVNLVTVPAEYHDKIRLAQTELPVITKNLEEMVALTESLVTLMGHDKPKRYLVLFQNNRELRATGGFIGSFALIDIDHGRVSSLEIPGGGPYDLMGGLTEQVISPQPLHLVNAKWQLQDANWWPDFPTSAEKIQWFYEHSGGPSVDGVITLTPDIIEQMLTITGPIAMPEYDAVVDSDNFYLITQTQAERKYDDTRESKKFIADLTPRLLDKLFTVDATTVLPMLQVVYNGLQQKDILVYFNDQFIEQEFQARGWTGEVKSTPGDYLEVVDTNIGGGKTDKVVQTSIQHHASIDAAGNVIDTVTLTREHTGQPDDLFANVKNVDYVRIYVPQGSELLSAEGFTQPDPNIVLPVESGYEQDADLQAVSGTILVDSKTQTRINQEFGKTVFGNWIQTEPGSTSIVTISYRLPFTVTRSQWAPGRYSLLLQKQPGSFDPMVHTSLDYPANWTLAWSYPATTLKLDEALTSDRFVGAVFE